MRIWQHTLGRTHFGIRDDFFQVGGHSLLAVQMIAEIEERFGERIDLSELLGEATIESLAERLRGRADRTSWSPLVVLTTGRDRQVPLFCVHPIGGNVLGYLELARCLGPEQPFYGLQAPGLDGVQPPFERLEDLAHYFISALRERQPKGPYCVAGHSFGGLVAYEIARQLKGVGEEVRFLALLDTPAPTVRCLPRDFDETEWLIRRARVLERFFGVTLGMMDKTLRPLAPEEQFDYFLNALKRADLLPPGASRTSVRSLLLVAKASYFAQLHYTGKPYSGDLTLFRARDRASDGLPILPDGILDDPALGWGALVEGRLDVYEVPGDHITMLIRPNVRHLAISLGNLMSEARGHDGTRPQCSPHVPNRK